MGREGRNLPLQTVSFTTDWYVDLQNKILPGCKVRCTEICIYSIQKYEAVPVMSSSAQHVCLTLWPYWGMQMFFVIQEWPKFASCFHKCSLSACSVFQNARCTIRSESCPLFTPLAQSLICLSRNMLQWRPSLFTCVNTKQQNHCCTVWSATLWHACMNFSYLAFCPAASKPDASKHGMIKFREERSILGLGLTSFHERYFILNYNSLRMYKDVRVRSTDILLSFYLLTPS